MIAKIEQLLKEVEALHASNAEELEALRIKYLSKKGAINDLMADFRNVAAEQKKEVEALIQAEGLHVENAKRYIQSSLKHEYASENGNALNEALPKMSPLNPQYRTKKQTVFQKISALVEKFKGIGGEL